MNNYTNYSKVDHSQSLDDRDAASKARVAAGKLRRERRNKAKELKKKYKEIRNTLNNTADKRELKEQYKAAILDIDTSLELNQSGTDRTIQDNGIDDVDSEVGGGGGVLPDGFDEETLDVVNNNNTVGQRVFLTKAV